MSKDCACSFPPPEGGNMYFRGLWEYCPEYNIGDVVLRHGMMYIALKHNAGHDPTDRDSCEYWHRIDSGDTHKKKGYYGIIDGGFATTKRRDEYAECEPVDSIDGGKANPCRRIPLI